MKLFGKFEAVKFLEENLIFVTNDKYLYYIYDPRYHVWRKYENAGNDSIHVERYPSPTKDELAEAMNGKFPKNETDFMKLCNSSQLNLSDMLRLLVNGYGYYMSYSSIYNAVRSLLLEAENAVAHKAYEEIKKIFVVARKNHNDKDETLKKIKDFCLEFLGRDIFKTQIGIVDGHDGSSYFWIMPVRIIDYSDTNEIDNVAEMNSVEISIEEDDVAEYLTPFLYKYYDDELKANKNRLEYCYKNDDGTEYKNYAKGFEWYLTHNFYTHESMEAVLRDIKDTIDALSSGRENEFTGQIIKGNYDTSPASQEAYRSYAELIVDFYRRFTYRMEYMLKVGKEKGFDLISFMGP